MLCDAAGHVAPGFDSQARLGYAGRDDAHPEIEIVEVENTMRPVKVCAFLPGPRGSRGGDDVDRCESERSDHATTGGDDASILSQGAVSLQVSSGLSRSILRSIRPLAKYGISGQ